jgi:hypothetical protein
VQDHPWERELSVSWESGSDVRLGWTVAYDGTVTPGAEAELFLNQVMRAAAPRTGAAPAP